MTSWKEGRGVAVSLAVRCVALSLGGAFVLLARPALAGPDLTHDPRVDPIPTFDDAVPDMAVVVGLRFGTSPGVASVQVVRGPAVGRPGEPQVLEARLAGLGGTVLQTLYTADPRSALVFGDTGRDSGLWLPDAIGYFTFPFRHDAASLTVTEVATGAALASVDLVPPAHAYCRTHPTQPECSGIVNRPPLCLAGGPYSAECSGPSTPIVLDGSGCTDPDGDPLTFAWSGPFVGGAATGATPSVDFPGYGAFSVGLSVSDDFSGRSSCTADVAVVDTIAPVIQCNSAATITPSDAPVTFTATASDRCMGDVTAAITAYDCFTFTSKGRRVDKRESCKVAISGGAITLVDSGGIGDHVSWDVTAADSSGNASTARCELTVVAKRD